MEKYQNEIVRYMSFKNIYLHYFFAVESEREKIKRRIVQAILPSHEHLADRDSSDNVECGLWDFAGSKDYYVTHQNFLTPHAIYVIVADSNDTPSDNSRDNTFDSVEGKHLKEIQINPTKKYPDLHCKFNLH